MHEEAVAVGLDLDVVGAAGLDVLEAADDVVRVRRAGRVAHAREQGVEVAAGRVARCRSHRRGQQERQRGGGETHGVDFTLVDSYLLGEPTSKADAIAALLADRSPLPEAAPFYRALEAVGVRAADEGAIIALRLVLAGRGASDENVRRLRAFSGVARAAVQRRQRRGLAALLLRRDAALLGSVVPGGDRAAIAEAARAAYRADLG